MDGTFSLACENFNKEVDRNLIIFYRRQAGKDCKYWEYKHNDNEYES